MNAFITERWKNLQNVKLTVKNIDFRNKKKTLQTERIFTNIEKWKNNRRKSLFSRGPTNLHIF